MVTVADAEIGISVGWFLTFAQVYINEVAPAHLRGIVFAVYQSQLCVGSIVGAAIDNGTHEMLGKEAYQIPLAIFFVAPTIQSASLFFFPESPRWLMTRGKEAAAKSALRRLRNKNIREAEFHAEFEEIKASMMEQSGHFKGKHLWIEMWKGINRRRSFLSIAVICFHSANGGSSQPLFWREDKYVQLLRILIRIVRFLLGKYFFIAF